ncbi:MMPL family transporter [Capillimicrobium parvum]|uniref:Apo-petrobactin exporter n=1 Tax=Capillimicrobium parvum TaxID=2884022 RepID=A0A9E6Y229_9ACTN|nr:MMPL family transporter [Capillimicrobium parvum]UGS38852.1 Apo-petrobactin exporter [Capillimicrobium parvum]
MRVVAWATGRRGRFVVIAAWLAAAVLGYMGHAKLPDVTQGGQTSFLPRHSNSTKATQALGQGGVQGGSDIPALIVFARDGGLTRADRTAIGGMATSIDRLGLRGATPAFAPFTERGRSDILGGAGLISRDGDAAVVPVGIDANVPGAITPAVHQIRRVVRAQTPPGLQAHVTGPAGTAVDFEQAADDAGRTLLFVTAGLVLVLLLVVYRAPALAVLPLIVVAAAYLVTAGLTYLLIEADAIQVNAEGTMLLLVLIFGAGTDYALLIVQRYREELGAGDGHEPALRRAVVGSAPAIGAAGATVIAAMLVLLLADLESTHWLGPVLALGIAVMLLAAFTLLPAVLAVLGPHAFWPTQAASRPVRSPRWVRVAALVRRRARVLIAAITAGLVVCAAGNLVGTQSIGFGQGILGTTDSGQGTELLNAHFPPGINSPLIVLVDVPVAGRALDALNDLREVDAAVPAGASRNGQLALIAVILDEDPYGSPAAHVVERIRELLAGLTDEASVGGITAENLDVEETNRSDTRIIVPVALLVVFAVLCLLLRALVAPLYLIVTVIASFAATLGIATVLFTKVLGEDGLTFNLTLMSFIFLVALGVDYNIFLMHRARDEAREHGTAEGVTRALVTTGGVVTGAGLILAGTFASLTVLPLEQLVQIGGTVALGVLLDTFVVRALLVPSITVVLGERAWWPGSGHPEVAVSARAP